MFLNSKGRSLFFRVALGLGVVTTTVALGLFAYLGTFTAL